MALGFAATAKIIGFAMGLIGVIVGARAQLRALPDGMIVLQVGVSAEVGSVSIGLMATSAPLRRGGHLLFRARCGGLQGEAVAGSHYEGATSLVVGA